MVAKQIPRKPPFPRLRTSQHNGADTRQTSAVQAEILMGIPVTGLLFPSGAACWNSHSTDRHSSLADRLRLVSLAFFVQRVVDLFLFFQLLAMLDDRFLASFFSLATTATLVEFLDAMDRAVQH